MFRFLAARKSVRNAVTSVTATCLARRDPGEIASGSIVPTHRATDVVLKSTSAVCNSQSETETISAPALRPQKTLAHEAIFSGIGFVSGADATLRFLPAPPNSGVTFVRSDLPGKPSIPADFMNLLHNDRRTALGCGTAVVEMTEHVLAALSGLGIDNCVIEIDASETPAADGSSLPFLQAIESAGSIIQPEVTKPIVIREILRIEDGAASIEIRPSSQAGLRVTYEINYANPGIGRQEVTFDVTPETFRDHIAPARTFVLAEEVEILRSMGIGIRHTAKDLLVYAADGSIVDNALRFPDECARHKLLDVIGDLALLGRPVQGEVIARRSGHRHNVALARKIREQAESNSR